MLHTAGGGTDAAALLKLQRLLETRECGSPAVDGYAHVKPECLETSVTNQWWQSATPDPATLVVHIERHADCERGGGREGVRACVGCVCVGGGRFDEVAAAAAAAAARVGGAATC